MAEAQATVGRSSQRYRDLEGQTRQLFNYAVEEDTKKDESKRELHAKAFEEMNDQQAKLLFNPDTTFFNSLAGNLIKYAEPMRNDTELQSKVAKLQGHINAQSLLKMCKIVFQRVGDIWTGILTLFTFGLELCRQMTLNLYDLIADTITQVIIDLGAEWIFQQGGWVLSATHSGMMEWFSSVAEGVTSWLSGSSTKP